MMLSLSDAVNCASLLMSQYNAGNCYVCSAAGFLNQLSSVCGNLWMLFIAITVYQHLRACFPKYSSASSLLSVQVSRRKSVGRSALYYVISSLVIWGASTVTAIIPLTGYDDMEYVKGSSGICWLGPDPALARYVLFYIPLWILITIILVLYFVTFDFVSVIPPDGPKYQVKRVRPRLFMFPLTMLIVFLPCTLNRVCESFGKTVWVLEYMQASVLPLWGFIDAVVYFFCKFRPIVHTRQMRDTYNPSLSTFENLQERIKVIIRVFY
ncbi:hypothetical protein Pelo_3604 [Pelomyxa schiedti]|nr:hypothetical protein Pelo_3604 [Pelomyxa schiedti]